MFCGTGEMEGGDTDTCSHTSTQPFGGWGAQGFVSFRVLGAPYPTLYTHLPSLYKHTPPPSQVMLLGFCLPCPCPYPPPRPATW